jgi:GNAT superfamily N-acetyltransferase
MGSDNKSALRPVKCPLCNNFESKRLTSFENHLVSEHKTTTQLLWNQVNGGPKKCACGCDQETKWIGWWKGYSTVINGHNASIYKMLDEESAREISRKRSESLKGKPGWSKGLTKETDDRIKQRAEATSRGRKDKFVQGSIKIWNKGLSVETDKRIAEFRENLKNKFAAGEITPWAKGLTKETDDRIKSMSQKVSLKMKQKQIRERLDHLKRLPYDEIIGRIEKTGQLKVIGGLENYINDAQKIIVVECGGCGKQFQGSLRSLQRGKCFFCSPGGSAAQEELAKWIESLGFNVSRNVRKTLGGLELDIFIEDKKFAIEYNGLYWHSHVNKTQGYHNNKTIIAEQSGIKLMHVFEDEWRDKRPIIQSMILSRLGVSKTNVAARKCVIRQLSKTERKIFFEENHADGDVVSMDSWGLINDKGEIVYSISVRKPFHKKHDGIEIARCCPKINHNVPGGISRLIKYVEKWAKEKGYKKIITYVDHRWGGSGNGYRKAGFIQRSKTPPRFWWTDFENRYNRFKFKADSSEGLTESQVAESAGVVKIWGCGNFIFELDV